MSRTAEPIACLYCGKAFRSPLSLAHHLDDRHKGWVERVLSNIGVEVPRLYPIPEYRVAIAKLLAVMRTPNQAA
jgi:hypothetical protein